MENDDRDAMRLAELQLRVCEHAILLAQLASAFGGLIESVRMTEGSNAPTEELVGVPDPDDLAETEADMPLGEAAVILADFFEMGADERARSEAMLGLGDEGA